MSDITVSTATGRGGGLMRQAAPQEGGTTATTTTMRTMENAQKTGRRHERKARTMVVIPALIESVIL